MNKIKCEFCEADEEVKSIYESDFWEVTLENKYGEKELYIDFHTSGWESVQDSIRLDIKFCPICGKKLKDKDIVSN